MNNKDELLFENGEYFKIVKEEPNIKTEGLTKGEINKRYIRSLAKWEYYYKPKSNIYFKVKRFSGKLYILDPSKKMWILSEDSYDYFMKGEFRGEEIEFNDIYKEADESDLNQKVRSK